MLKNKTEEVISRLDRLVDWNASLTKRDKFIELLNQGRKLRIKYGVDLTANSLHLGHAVNLQAMRILQDCGHEVQFLAGSFTTQVGDPTGKSKTRKTISLEDIANFKKSFLKQAGMVLNLNPDVFSEHDNLNWWSKMNLQNFFGILSELTHAQLIQRDMFQERIKAGNPIAITEMLYPVLQGWDSVELESDLTIVGTDQLFNEKMGRQFQQRSGQTPQEIICTVITPGLDGGEKQSKSIGNYVGLAHTPFEKFSRTMLLLDDLVPQWMEVYTNATIEELEECKNNLSNDPLKWKKRLAWMIVERFHGSDEATKAQDRFNNERLGDDHATDVRTVDLSNKNIIMACASVLKESNSWIRRMLDSNAIRVNDEKITDENYTLSSGDLVRVGKKKANRVFKVK